MFGGAKGEFEPRRTLSSKGLLGDLRALRGEKTMLNGFSDSLL